MGKKIYESITTKNTMNKVKEPRMPFDWSINPYRGCSHGCSFCYARATHSFLGLGADDSFQNHIYLKSNAAEALELQLSKTARKHGGDLAKAAREVGVVAVGTVTDPYQPVEAKAKITRECLKVLAAYQIPTIITTRSPLILRDVDILRTMNITSINISLQTLDADIIRRLEPQTPMPNKRLEAAAKLVENGLTTGISMAPILPYLTDADHSMESLICAAKQHGASFVMPSILRLKPEVKTWFFQTLGQHYPELLPSYMKLFSTGYAPSSYAQPIMQQIYLLLQKYRLDDGVPAPNLPDVEPPAEFEQLSFQF